MQISSVKLGLIGGVGTLARQLRLLIVHDCLSSLAELLECDQETDDNAEHGAAADSSAPWAELQQLSCANNFIPKMDASLVRLSTQLCALTLCRSGV